MEACLFSQRGADLCDLSDLSDLCDLSDLPDLSALPDLLSTLPQQVQLATASAACVACVAGKCRDVEVIRADLANDSYNDASFRKFTATHFRNHELRPTRAQKRTLPKNPELFSLEVEKSCWKSFWGGVDFEARWFYVFC